MTKPKKDYEKHYRAQRKRFYKNYLSQLKELDAECFTTSLAQLKLQNMDDLDIITEVEKELE
jgi:hypothetical protein